ncbi:hypothetical protein G7046_g2355 [Stylonectria norvegica]|nr:hypothetical protein G7046_g2355 [Stylonectria norvegica]
MRSFSRLVFGLVCLLTATLAKATVQGFDISDADSSAGVDFRAARDAGARFVIIQATNGTRNRDPSFGRYTIRAAAAHLIHGAYHVAQPDMSTGQFQAAVFLTLGGGWIGNGKTLPGVVGLVDNPNKASCYGLSPDRMVAWISQFVDFYHRKARRYPMIYTTNTWWRACTGNSQSFAKTSPLFIAGYNGTIGVLPGGWTNYTIWQNSRTYSYGGNSDVFRGSKRQLQRLAKG